MNSVNGSVKIDLKTISLLVGLLVVLGGAMWSIYDSRLTQQQQVAELQKEILELRNQSEGNDKLLQWQVSNGFDRVEKKVDKIYDEFPQQLASAIDGHEKHMHPKEWGSPSSPTADPKNYVIEKPKTIPAPMPKDLTKMLNGGPHVQLAFDPYPYTLKK